MSIKEEVTQISDVTDQENVLFLSIV